MAGFGPESARSGGSKVSETASAAWTGGRNARFAELAGKAKAGRQAAKVPSAAMTLDAAQVDCPRAQWPPRPSASMPARSAARPVKTRQAAAGTWMVTAAPGAKRGTVPISTASSMTPSASTR